MKIIAQALVEIKPVYYPREEKLLNLVILKLYRGEEVVQQNQEDLDPDPWSDEGELTKLPELPSEETKVGAWEQPED